MGDWTDCPFIVLALTLTFPILSISRARFSMSFGMSFPFVICVQMSDMYLLCLNHHFIQLCQIGEVWVAFFCANNLSGSILKCIALDNTFTVGLAELASGCGTPIVVHAVDCTSDELGELIHGGIPLLMTHVPC